MDFTILLVIVAIFIGRSYGKITEEGRQWHWTCDEKQERCLRKAIILKEAEPLKYTSAQLCRLLCGQHGALWPKPTVSTNLRKELIPVHPNITTFNILNAEGDAKEFLQENSKILLDNMWTECGSNCSAVPKSKLKINIHVASSDLSLNWDTNESYSLEVSSEGSEVTVHVSSENVFGARHGLETLIQLMASYPVYPKIMRSSLRGLVIIAGAQILDKPVYTHRGLLLDTSRNFFPISVIKKQIDAMASVKLNVLHWHATDSQSFPLVSTRVPQMTSYGAYSEDMVYHPSEVKELLYYAKLRGIRIILEIDTPAHSGFGWQWGPEYNLGNLSLCINWQPWRDYCIDPPCGQLNPINPNVFTVLSSIYKDFIELFPKGEAFHVGGDEVVVECWNSSTEVVDFLKQNGKGVELKDFLELWGNFHSASLNEYDKIVGHKDTPMIVWSSGLTDPKYITNYLPKERFVVETWVTSTDKLPQTLMQMGYKVIMSTKNAWYLDHGFCGKTQYYKWETVYDNELPVSKNLLGGEVCMWGEYVDEHNLDSRIWPRAAAAAERLWSNPSTKSTKSGTRFYTHRERLVKRGLKPETLAPLWCHHNEEECS